MADQRSADGWSSVRSWLPASPDQMLNAIGEALIVTDRVGMILFWNDAAEVTYGWSAAEVMGRDLREVVPAEPSIDQTAKIVALLGTKQRWSGEITVCRRDGSPLIAQVTNTPVFDDKGNVAARIGVSRDVTELRRTTDALETSRHRFRAVLRGSGDLFTVTDTDGVITFLDGPVEAYFGLSADVLIGSSLFDLVQPSDLGRARTLWARRLSTMAPLPAEEFWMQRPDGSWRCLSLLFSNLVDDPAIAGIIATGRDVTRNKYLIQAHDAMNAAGALLIEATDETELFNRICRLVVDDSGYNLAWIGVTDATRPLGVRMVASAIHPASDASDYFNALEALARTQTYRGPFVTAMETHRPCVVQDCAALDESLPWRQFALDHGYRSLIALPLTLGGHDSGVMAIYSSRTHVFSKEAVTLLSALAADLAYGVDGLRTRIQSSSYRARFEAGVEATVRAVAAAAELRDSYTAGHQRRVAELASAIAVEIGLAPDVVDGIRVGASIHDIGKLAVPIEILTREGQLSAIEFAIIQQHPQAGHDIVAGIDFPWPVADMILQHHERQDGSGYPNGLHGNEIAIGARIIAVADTVESMQFRRPYRAALGATAALQAISDGRGTLYDCDVVDACTRLLNEKNFSFAR